MPIAIAATSPGVLPVGRGTGTVRRRPSIARGGFPASGRTAFIEADQHCRDQGKVFTTTSMTAEVVMDAAGQDAFSRMLECLAAGSPARHRLNLKSVPGIVIWQR